MERMERQTTTRTTEAKPTLREPNRQTAERVPLSTAAMAAKTRNLRELPAEPLKVLAGYLGNSSFASLLEAQQPRLAAAVPLPGECGTAPYPMPELDVRLTDPIDWTADVQEGGDSRGYSGTAD